MRKRVFLLVVLAAVLLLVGFSAPQCSGDVMEGAIRDTIGNVEKSRNGNWSVWMTNDTAAGYCTTDDELGEYALKLLENHTGEVILRYREIFSGDPEYNTWSASDCSSIYKGGTEMEMFYIESITPVPARTLPAPGG